MEDEGWRPHPSLGFAEPYYTPHPTAYRLDVEDEERALEEENREGGEGEGRERLVYEFELKFEGIEKNNSLWKMVWQNNFYSTNTPQFSMSLVWIWNLRSVNIL